MVIGQLLPRYSGSPEVNYNSKVVEVNKTLRRYLQFRADITYWNILLLRDNVHLNDDGMEKYPKSVRAAVESPSRC